jgi:hypothetical protein
MPEEKDPSDDNRPATRGRFFTFWKTLPGILTGVAAVVTAIVSLVAVFHPLGHGSGPQVASTTGGGPSLTVVSTSATTLATKLAGVLAQGQLSQRPGDSVDLAHGRVGNGVPGADLSLLGGGVGGQVFELTSLGGPLAPISGQAIDKMACTAALGGRNDTYELLSQFSVGSQLCVETHDNHVAALRIIGLPGVGDPALVYAYTVWQ